MTFEPTPVAPLTASTADDIAPAAVVADSRLADVAALLAAAFDAPMAALLGCADERHAVLAEHGLGMRLGPLSRDHLFVRCWGQCAPQLVLPDIPAGPRSPVRFLAGTALHAGNGQRLGTLVVCDRHPRQAPTPTQLDTLARLGRVAANLLEQRQLERTAKIVTQAGAQAREAVLIADRHGHVQWRNPAAERLFGSALGGVPMHTLFPLRLQADAGVVQEWLAGRGTGSVQLRIVAPDGSLRLLEATRTAWQHGPDHGTTLILHDITEASQQRAQLDRLAHYDPLTGLPNRNALLAALEAHPDWGMALIGIDRFKWINDSLGHALGDRVLQAFADRLQIRAEADLCVARVGGDVFAIACPDARLAASSPDDSGKLLPSWLRHLEQPLRIRGHEIHAEISAGIALRGDVPGGDLLACADLALFRAKSTGGRQLCRYQPSMRTQALARRDLDLDLRRAFAQSEFEMYYQPQVDLANGRICGAEALLRWHHPLRGVVPAGEFIDVLTHSPLGAEVGAWVLQRACMDAAQWPDTATSVSINLFPAQLRDELVGHVDAALATSGLVPERLELEITETTALTHDSAGAGALARLREKGVNLAFDDFGTGYASLSMLQRFKIDRVKIDRSFVSGMLGNEEDAAIVRWIVMLARALGLRVVAEGVEQVTQAEMLRNLGCDEAQGYLYARALDPGTLLARLHAQQTGVGHA